LGKTQTCFYETSQSLSFLTDLAQVLIKITESGFNHFFLFATWFDLGIEASLKPI